MLKKIYSLGFSYPRLIIIGVVAITAFFAMQLDGLRWETDARVYLPRGHEAILYDEKVDDIFGVKDTLIVSVINEKDGIYNTETLARIARITKKVMDLPGVIALRDVDVASLSTATVFEGDHSRMGSVPVMPRVPTTEAEFSALKNKIETHKDILVGNLVSADGKGAMIRIKIKEGAQHRYMTYFQVKNIIAEELGEQPDWGPWAGDSSDDGKWGGNEWVNADGTLKNKDGAKSGEWKGNKWVNADGTPKAAAKQADKEEKDWSGNEWVNADGTPKKVQSETKTEEAWGGNKWVNADGSPKAAAQQKEIVEKDWSGNQWVNVDGTAKVPPATPENPDPNFAGNQWVNPDGTVKPDADKKTGEENWQGNAWVNADGSPKVKPATPDNPDPNFAGNKWVNPDGTTKESTTKSATTDDWQGNAWVNADGSAKVKPATPDNPDPNFAGNKWVNPDGTAKESAAKSSAADGWQGNDWVNADGSPKVQPATPENPDPNFAGNKWVKADGTPKEDAPVNSEEANWQGNAWVNADGTARTQPGTPENPDPNFAGNKWVNADGTPKPAASQLSKDEENWFGNEWLNADGSLKVDLSKTKPSEVSWQANEFVNPDAETQAKKSNGLDDIPAADPTKTINDQFFLAGRPVIEVSSGLYAMADIEKMVPLLIGAMALILLIIFRTWRGMLLPIMVMAAAIIWTFGLMVLVDVPLYTISTMLPVILVAVGIGDGVHLLSSYYDKVLHNPQESSFNIVSETTLNLGPPLIMTSVTTAIGFLALIFAEMPPFRIFGVFALIGILFSWFISITLLPAILTLLKPKVGNYLAKRRAIRVYDEQNRLSYFLTQSGRWIETHRKQSVVALVVLALVSLFGASRLYVDSSWMSDFRDDTDIAVATNVLNTRFSGSIFLNVVIESEEKDAFKNPELLRKMEGLQNYVATLPFVGDSISVVDYIKSMNQVLHAGDAAFKTIPDSKLQIGEYLFLFSVSGRPQQLDEVVDFDYKKGLISIIIQTDHTKELKHIIDSVNDYVANNFQGMNVDVNLSGSGNNSYVWAKLLIDSQTTAVILSKVVILFVAALVFASFVAGVFVVIPVTLSTLFVAGVAGFLGISLDVSTALAAGIAIGVGVDYAIHYLFRYRREREKTGDHLQATEATLRSTGHTIVLNAIVVAFGFSVLFFSEFPPHVKLGVFVTSYMVVSCIIAVWVLPALLSYFRPRFAESTKT